MPASALQAVNLCFHYPRTGWQLGPLSLTIQTGILTGLIGPNGSGKSTLLNLLARRSTAQGSLTLAGRPAGRFSDIEWARTVAYLPQQIPLHYDFSVEEAIAFGRYPHTGFMGFLQPRDHEIIERCLIDTELTGLRSRMLSELSGGERQRVFLASVLAQEPHVLFLDEPLTALDIHHQVAFYRVLQQCCRNGITVVLATHELTMAAHFCEELLLLSQGSIVKHGSPREVLQEELLHSVYSSNVRIVFPDNADTPVIVPAFD